jgi:hypothetical protein
MKWILSGVAMALCSFVIVFQVHELAPYLFTFVMAFFAFYHDAYIFSAMSLICNGLHWLFSPVNGKLAKWKRAE